MGEPLVLDRKPDAARLRSNYRQIRLTNEVMGSLLREMAAALEINEFLKDLTDNAKPLAAGSHGQGLVDLVQQIYGGQSRTS